MPNFLKCGLVVKHGQVMDLVGDVDTRSNIILLYLTYFMCWTNCGGVTVLLIVFASFVISKNSFVN